MIPTTELAAGGAEAACTYSIRAESVDGPPLRYATIGQKAFHVWECEMDGPAMDFQILVHECVVSDEGSKKMVRFSSSN